MPITPARNSARFSKAPRSTAPAICSPLGEPLYRIEAKDGVSRLTNAAYGGADRKTLYICDSYNGRILAARLPVAGVPLFSHL